MDSEITVLARRLLSGEADLTASERRVLRRIAERRAIARDADASYRSELTLGERLADRVAAFGGSWAFIGIFAAVLLAWVALNAAVLPVADRIDPYPFIFLNLILSMLAAVQAPIIMMSQNRQAAKDRIAAAHDYEVNLKAELEIMSLHEKLDDLRMKQLQELFDRQAARLDRIAAALDLRGG
jgi:uncharacterized membrane protein